MVDAIQSEYGWTDEYVLDRRLSRIVQIRDAMFIRAQAEMFARHQEIEWLAKHLALMMVNTTPSDDKNWRKNVVETIFDWDMDKPPTSEDDDATEEDLSSEEAIEAMWAKGAEAAFENNMSKQSFGSVKLS